MLRLPAPSHGFRACVMCALPERADLSDLPLFRISDKARKRRPRPSCVSTREANFPCMKSSSSPSSSLDFETKPGTANVGWSGSIRIHAYHVEDPLAPKRSVIAMVQRSANEVNLFLLGNSQTETAKNLSQPSNHSFARPYMVISHYIRYGVYFVVVMDFGSNSVAISVRHDHNDENIMKRRRRTEEVEGEGGIEGGNEDLGKIVIVVEAQLNQPQIKSRLSPRDSSGKKIDQGKDVTAIKTEMGSTRSSKILSILFKIITKRHAAILTEQGPD